MQFTVFYFIFSVLLNTPVFIISMILARDKKPHFKEITYIFFAILATSFFTNIIQFAFHFGFLAHLMFNLIPYFTVYIYFRKIKSYSYRKCFPLTIFALLITIVADILVLFIINNIAPGYFELLYSVHLQAPPYLILQTVPFIFFFGAVSIIAAILIVRLSRKIRSVINKNEHAQTLLLIISIAIFAIIEISTNIMRYQQEFREFINSWETLFLLGFSITIFISFFFYIRSLRERMSLQELRAEQKIQQQYTDQVEMRQIAVQKFRHDYQNILLSINGFVMTEDWDELKQYMKKVHSASAIIENDNLALESIRKVKPLEIKYLLAEKLMLAQSLGLDITTKVEVHEEIDHIPGNSVNLVRMLGIILDNAVEALAELQRGMLSVACYNDGGNVVFIIQNTCSSDSPPFAQLKKEGFSTKSIDRGLGLNILSELVDTHPNITLHTSIKDNKFTQKLSIGES